MQISIGAKIKELRKRDGRTQEALANAIGVTAQAISRWEANGGYPDMEIIPSIANYFHITIDELFGYSEDREKKIKKIMDESEKAICAQGDMTECIDMLRAAAEEFPTEPEILINLGTALRLQGYRKYGVRFKKDEGDSYAVQDTEYNSQNELWQEQLRVYEKVLKMDISADNRTVVTFMLVNAYAEMGYNEKAKELSEKQNPVITSRELLITKATVGEERDKYQGEAILSLLTELKTLIINSVATNLSVCKTEYGTDLILTLADFYEKIFIDGRCGIGHNHLAELYLTAAEFEAKFGADIQKAKEYFDKGFEHKKKYDSIYATGEYSYTSPLVSKVTFPSGNFPALSPDYWKIWVEIMPDKLRKLVASEKKFAECFEY